MDISIITPTYNNPHLIKPLLDSFLLQEGLDLFNYEILVVDNNSPDDAVKRVVESYIPKFNNRLRYLFEEKRGISDARNKGITESKGKYLIFIDDDCIPNKDWIKEIYKVYQKYDADVVQGKNLLGVVIPEDCPYTESFLKTRFGFIDYFKDVQEMREENTQGANMSIKRSVLEKIGGFDTSKTYYYCEDTELSMRMKRAGLKRFYTPYAVIHHHFELDRLTDEKFYTQSYYWGKAAILWEPTQLPAWRHFIYCLKELFKRYYLLFGQYFREDEKAVFTNRCQICGLLGRCAQLLKGAKR